jgi:hypothetical protein
MSSFPVAVVPSIASAVAAAVRAFGPAWSMSATATFTKLGTTRSHLAGINQHSSHDKSVRGVTP